MAVTPNSEVRLLSVPFSNDYKHTRDFSSKSDQTTYMLTKVKHSYDKFTYQRQERTLKIPANIDTILDCNYVMYQNTNYNTKWFYAFITSKHYVNPNMTELTLETDVFQTWQFDMVPRQSFIERKHTDRWNTDGTPVINTVDEGLNYGTEYDVVEITHFHPQTDVQYLVIVTKNTLHQIGGSPGIVVPQINAIPQPLSFYIQPFKASGIIPDVTIGGTPVTMTTVETLLSEIYKDTAAVNNVVSLYVTDNIGVNVTYDGTIHLPSGNFTSEVIGTGTVPVIYCKELKSYEVTLKNIGDKYAGYTDVTESKLLMYPYTTLTLSDSKGQQVTLKNEYVNGTTLSIVSTGSLGTSNKVAYYVDQYLNVNTLDNDHVADLEHAIISESPNDIPIITDYLSAYLQGNKNAIEQRKTAINISADLSRMGSVLGGAGGAISSLRHGNVGGALSSGIHTAHNLFTAGVNEQVQIADINAKMRDISNVPPSITNMGGNIYYDFGNQLTGVYVIKKEITDEYRYKLLDYFKAYGYKINKMQTPEWKSRSDFNYIKTVGINLQGDIPTDDMNRLKGIFDNGVTIWHVDDVGNYNLENAEV